MRKTKQNDRIPLARPDITKREFAYVRDCFDTNYISQGFYNEKFESMFAKWIGARYATLCSSGTGALWLALRACNIGKGDEVIVPAFTFSATAASVAATGADVVFVDVLEANTTIDPAAVEKAITAKTKAIIVVDLYGFSANYRALKKIADKYHLYLIEDAAESLGGSYGKAKLGTLCDIGCFSLFANKVITSGEGGVCVSNSRELYEKIVLFKNHGTHRTPAYYAEVPGFNLRMTNLQAAIACGQLERIDTFLSKRYKIFEEYQRLIRTAPNVTAFPYSHMRDYGPWMYTVRVPAKFRDKLVSELSLHGIESRPGFHALHQTPAFESYARGDRFPVAEKLALEVINLPTFVGMTPQQIRRVVDTLRAVMKSLYE